MKNESKADNSSNLHSWIKSGPGEKKNPKEKKDEDDEVNDSLGEPDGRAAATNDHAKGQITNSSDDSGDWERINQ